MRGDDVQQEAMFSYLSPEARVPQDHPLRPIRQMVNQALTELSGEFQAMYSHEGRPSIPPEKLLCALLLQVFYSSFAPLKYGELLKSIDDNVEISPKRGGWIIKVGQGIKNFFQESREVLPEAL